MINGLHFVRTVRRGKPIRWYVYAWRGGPRIMTADSPTKPKLTPEAVEELGRALAESRVRDHGTLGALIRDWRASLGWSGLASSTRGTWGHALDVIEAKWARTPLSLWSDPRMMPKVVHWRNTRAGTPRAADIGVTVLRNLLRFGRLQGVVTMNVAEDIPSLYHGADRAEIVWTDEDIERFSWSALALNRPHVIDGIWLACLTGLRRADLIGLTFREVTDHAIVRVAAKRSRGRRRRAVVPLMPETKRLLDELRGRKREQGVDTLLVNSRGRPWLPGSFTQAFNEVRDHAGIEHLSEEDGRARSKHLHDCRGTFVTRLCRTNLTNEEIARIVAWSPQSVDTVRRIYVDDAAIVVALSERIRAAL